MKKYISLDKRSKKAQKNITQDSTHLDGLNPVIRTIAKWKGIQPKKG